VEYDYSTTTNIYEAPVPVQEVYEETTVAPAPAYESSVQPAAYAAPESVSPPVGETNSASESAPIEPTLVDQGNAAFNAGEYERAGRLYLSAVLADQNTEIARLFYGLAQFALGDYELAATAMRRAILIGSDMIERPVDLRSIYPDLQTFENHVERLYTFVSEHPGDRNALFLLGFVHYASAHPDQAVTYLRTLTDLDPTDELAIKIRDRAAEVIRNAPTPSEK